jgi:hypothetical protein
MAVWEIATFHKALSWLNHDLFTGLPFGALGLMGFPLSALGTISTMLAGRPSLQLLLFIRRSLDSTSFSYFKESFLVTGPPANHNASGAGSFFLLLRSPALYWSPSAIGTFSGANP